MVHILIEGVRESDTIGYCSFKKYQSVNGRWYFLGVTISQQEREEIMLELCGTAIIIALIYYFTVC